MKETKQKYLLKLARQTLEHYFASGQTMDSRFRGNDIDDELKEKRGTFVTLHKNGQLRGCIGHIEPVQEVYLDIIDNTLAAAFEDPRFNPLQKEETGDIEIEISVLTKPEELKYSSPEDLLKKLQPLRDGVIIQKGRYGATYLPQVWEDLPDKENFLSSLCRKAGLSANEWREGELTVRVYQAEVFRE